MGRSVQVDGGRQGVAARGGLYRRAEAGKGVAARVDGRWVPSGGRAGVLLWRLVERAPVVVSDLAAREECEWAGLQYKPK